MALSTSTLKLISDKVLIEKGNNLSCCILGFPRINTPLETLESIFQVKLEKNTFHEVLETYGYSDIKVLDAFDYEDAEIVHNLNDPLQSGHQEFDLVIDNGTIEHCYNVGQAMMNAAQLCELGGKIFHLNPANWFGHGFWNFNPCTYFDFYQQNGFEVKVYLREIPTGTYTEIKYKPNTTEILPAKRYTTHAVAIRKELKDITFPFQKRYEKFLK